MLYFAVQFWFNTPTWPSHFSAMKFWTKVIPTSFLNHLKPLSLWHYMTKWTLQYGEWKVSAQKHQIPQSSPVFIITSYPLIQPSLLWIAGIISFNKWRKQNTTQNNKILNEHKIEISLESWKLNQLTPYIALFSIVPVTSSQYLKEKWVQKTSEYILQNTFSEPPTIQFWTDYSEMTTRTKLSLKEQFPKVWKKWKLLWQFRHKTVNCTSNPCVPNKHATQTHSRDFG